MSDRSDLLSRCLFLKGAMLTKKMFKCIMHISICFILAIWIFVLFFYIAFGYAPVLVLGTSMTPTLYSGELYWGKRLTDNELPERGDIVVFWPDSVSPIRYVKRVIGIPGDIITADDDALFVNGCFVDKIVGTGTWFADEVPADNIFVIGDNRAVSMDSRRFGFIPVTHVDLKILSP